MNKIILKNNGGYMGMENVSFPVQVSVSDSNSASIAIPSSEMERIGADMSAFECDLDWWFVISEHCDNAGD
ncbi:hypothetical protein D3C79_286850 [compost metagenome]